MKQRNKKMLVLFKTEGQLSSPAVILSRFLVPCIRPQKEAIKWIRIKTAFKPAQSFVKVKFILP